MLLLCCYCCYVVVGDDNDGGLCADSDCKKNFNKWSGPVVLALTLSASSRAFFEILYEECQSTRFLHKAHPKVVAMTSFS